MNRNNPEEVAENWWRFSFEGEDDDGAHWAFLTLDDLVRKDPLAAWEIVKLLLSKATSPHQAGVIGAGPLEDLLATHPDTVLPWLSVASAELPLLPESLQAIYKSRLSPETAAQVVRLAARVSPN